MNCPNCGLPNPDNAKFCANCGTSFTNAPSGQYQPPSPQFQNPSQYLPPSTPGSGGGNSMFKNIGIGCLIAVAIMLFVGLSCTRACFAPHRVRYVHRY